MVEEQALLCVLTRSPQVGHYRYFMSRGGEDPRLDIQRTNERTEAMKSRISEKFEKNKEEK